MSLSTLATLHKTCSKCGETKLVAGFYPMKNRTKSVDTVRNSWMNECKVCVRARTKLVGLNRSKAQRRQYILQARYGLSIEQYDELLLAQNGVCAICGTPPPAGKYLHVDHDHACCATHKRSCGKCIRGLLCFQCNIMIGSAGDNSAKLQNAINYLKRVI